MSGPRQANVTVVGGGVLGCSGALHLNLCGCGRVALVGQGQIGEGTPRRRCLKRLAPLVRHAGVDDREELTPSEFEELAEGLLGPTKCRHEMDSGANGPAARADGNPKMRTLTDILSEGLR